MDTFPIENISLEPKNNKEQKSVKILKFIGKQLFDFVIIALLIFFVLPFLYNIYDFFITGTEKVNQYFNNLFSGKDGNVNTVEEFINLIKKNEDLDDLSITEKELKEKFKNYYRTINGLPVDVKNISPETIINTTKKYIGIPYKYGEESERATDCSGLIWMVFLEHGITLPRTAQEQSKLGTMVLNKQNLRKGDLVFFTDVYNKSERFITHVGLYVGSGWFINATSSFGVVYSNLEDIYWKRRYIFATRIF